MSKWLRCNETDAKSKATQYITCRDKHSIHGFIETLSCCSSPLQCLYLEVCANELSFMFTPSYSEVCVSEQQPSGMNGYARDVR